MSVCIGGTPDWRDAGGDQFVELTATPVGGDTRLGSGILLGAFTARPLKMCCVCRFNTLPPAFAALVLGCDALQSTLVKHSRARFFCFGPYSNNTHFPLPSSLPIGVTPNYTVCFINQSQNQNQNQKPKTSTKGRTRAAGVARGTRPDDRLAARRVARRQVVVAARPPPLVPVGTLLYGEKGVLNGHSSTRVSLWDSLMFGRVLEY